MAVRKLTIDQARRATLGAQGFGRPQPKGRVDRRHFRRLFRDIGLLQLDSVNVLERSHYLPVFARLGGYSKAALDRYTVESGEVYEYWGHAASLLPTELYPVLNFRTNGRRPWKRAAELIERRPAMLDAILDEVADKGPLQVGHLEEPGNRQGSWWGWGDGKTALEWLFATGRLTAYRSKHFARLYDLPERVIPREHLEAPPLPEPDAYRRLIGLAAEHFGVGTMRDLCDYYRLNIPKARPFFKEMVAAGELIEVDVAAWDQPAYADPELRIPKGIEGSALLSPFDPIVWERDRARRLFDFHYRIEIYTPEPQRVFGYYVLPYMLDGELVGRVDLKADRHERVLRVQGAYVEPGRDAQRIARILEEDLDAMCIWLGLEGVVRPRRGNLKLG